MKKKDKETKLSIEPGKPVEVTAPTRAEAAAKVEAYRKEAKEKGLVETSDGFIWFDPTVEGDKFSAILAFDNPKEK